MRTTERIILVLIALTWTIEPIIVVPIALMRITARIVLELIAPNADHASRIIALLSARMQTIAPIIRGRGPRLRSTPRRSVRHAHSAPPPHPAPEHAAPQHEAHEGARPEPPHNEHHEEPPH